MATALSNLMPPASYPKPPTITLPQIPVLNSDNLLSVSAWGVPIATIGLIAITSIVLAYVTINEENGSSPKSESTGETKEGGNRTKHNRKGFKMRRTRRR